jgi:hypothetical protein
MSVIAPLMRPILVLLAALFLLSVGVLAAGCTMPTGDDILPTPTETAATPAETMSPAVTGTMTPPLATPTDGEMNTTGLGSVY